MELEVWCHGKAAYCYICKEPLPPGAIITLIRMPIYCRYPKQRKKLKGDTAITLKCHKTCAKLFR